jgi:hypothetical protein
MNKDESKEKVLFIKSEEEYEITFYIRIWHAMKCLTITNFNNLLKYYLNELSSWSCKHLSSLNDRLDPQLELTLKHRMRGNGVTYISFCSGNGLDVKNNIYYQGTQSLKIVRRKFERASWNKQCEEIVDEGNSPRTSLDGRKRKLWELKLQKVT